MEGVSPLRIYGTSVRGASNLITAWGRVGGVGVGTVACLKERLGATEFGEIDPCEFFESPVSVREGMVQEARPPRSKFHHWENPKGDDLLLFVADGEPQRRRYEYASLILQRAAQCKAKAIIAVCGIPTVLQDAKSPKVFGVVNDVELARNLDAFGVLPLDHPNLARMTLHRGVPVETTPTSELTSMNALLLALAARRGLPGTYLLAEVPYYAIAAANPDSCRAVLRVLTAMLDLDIDLRSIDETVRTTVVECRRRARGIPRRAPMANTFPLSWHGSD